METIVTPPTYFQNVKTISKAKTHVSTPIPLLRIILSEFLYELTKLDLSSGKETLDRKFNHLLSKYKFSFSKEQLTKCTNLLNYFDKDNNLIFYLLSLKHGDFSLFKRDLNQILRIESIIYAYMFFSTVEIL